MNAQPVKLHLVAAARPNFMKVAPLYHALAREPWCRALVVHTGQHYDREMSEFFFRDLGLPEPDIHLGVRSGTHAEQTAGVMVAYERVCLEHRPDWTIVVGDVNSTLAAALVAAKLGIRVAHLEAGLRSGDRAMPEEINRLLTDDLADLLWTPSPDADRNLLEEGVPPERIVRVGNIMIDSFEMLRERIAKEHAAAALGLEPGRYGVVTLHRPSNVDDRGTLVRLFAALREVAQRAPLVFPIHPRTRARIAEFGIGDTEDRSLRLVEPLGYIRFMSLVGEAAFVITDSGGIQEETTYLGIPCLTLRDTTERPVTVSEGTNRLVGPDALSSAVGEIRQGRWPRGRRPELWDGRTAGRVVASLKRACGLDGAASATAGSRHA